MRRHHELSFGAEPQGAAVRFRLWAPAADAVMLRIEEGGRLLFTSPAAPPLIDLAPQGASFFLQEPAR